MHGLELSSELVDSHGDILVAVGLLQVFSGKVINFVVGLGVLSTMAARAKAKAVQRNQKVALCVLDEQWPLTYLQVYADAKVETDLDANVDLGMRIAGVMAGTPMPEEVRPMIAEGVVRENRVVLRLTPYATFETPPRHVYSADDVNENLTHELGTSLPW